MKISTLFMLPVIAMAAMTTMSYAQRPLQQPPTAGGVDRRDAPGGIRPCSRLEGPGSCSPGASIDVLRYVPPPHNSLSGGLRLQIRPASAAVGVDGRYAGQVNAFDGTSERLVLTPGPHSVTIRAPGFEPLEIHTLTRAGQTTIYRGALSPLRHN
jgi:hypothetical protein